MQAERLFLPSGGCTSRKTAQKTMLQSTHFFLEFPNFTAGVVTVQASSELSFGLTINEMWCGQLNLIINL